MRKLKTRKPGWWIPWSFIAFFAVVVSVNAGLVVMAFDSWTGISTPDAYRRGLAYNNVLEAEAAQRRQGWRAVVGFVPTGKRRGRIEVALSDRRGAALGGLDIGVRFVRPTSAGRDFVARLTGRGKGRYAADITFPLAGQWRAELVAKRGRALHRASKTILVR